MDGKEIGMDELTWYESFLKSCLQVGCGLRGHGHTTRRSNSSFRGVARCNFCDKKLKD